MFGLGNFQVTVNASNSAQYITSYLPKFPSGTLAKAGSSIVAQQFIYINGDKFYPSNDKTKAIETGFGLQLCSNNVNANSSPSATAIRQKYNNATLTNIPHATLTAGDPCYFRCTMDANGNIYSDDYVDTQMVGGYTWYYVGIATSSTAINTDTTQSFFITLDSNGNLTHINGKEIKAGNIPTKTSDLTNDSGFVNINEVYPVGSIVNTKTNSNPSTSYGGTWSLIGKNFIGLASGLATIFTANTTNVSNVVRTMERIGNIITLHLELTTAVALSDNAVNLGTVNFANIGITRLWSSLKQVPCGTDDGNGIALLSIDYESGAVQSTDVITKTSGGTIPAGSTIEANFVLNIPQSYMIDSFCNRFTWERTA